MRLFKVTECFDGLLVTHRALEPWSEDIWWYGVVLGQGRVRWDSVPVLELHSELHCGAGTGENLQAILFSRKKRRQNVESLQQTQSCFFFFWSLKDLQMLT